MGRLGDSFACNGREHSLHDFIAHNIAGVVLEFADSLSGRAQAPRCTSKMWLPTAS